MSADLNNSRDLLRSFVSRIEHVEEEIRELNADKSDIYKEARGQGFDVKTMRKVIALRKMEPDAREEQDALLDTYLIALGMLPDFEEADRAPARTREIIEEIPPHDAETGEIVEATEQRENVPSQHEVESRAGYRQLDQATVRNPGVTVVGDESGTLEDQGSGGDAVGAVNANGGLPDTDGVEPSPPVRVHKPLRPHCLNPELCAGSGSSHCFKCRKAMQSAEVAA